MESKLEQKLLKYENGTPLSDSELIEIIEDIIEIEEALPVDQRDFDLIEEAIDAVLTLKGADMEYLELRAEYISEKRINALASEGRRPASTYKKTLKLAKLIPIAAAFVLIISSLVVSASNVSFFSDIYGYIKNKIYPISEITTVGELYTYDTIEELSAQYSDYVPLLPYKLPEGFSVKDISVQVTYVETSKNNFKNIVDINVKMLSNGSQQKLSITNDIDDNFIRQGKTKIGEHDVYYKFSENIHVGKFVYEESGYTVSASTYEDLITLIESLTEKE